MTVSITYKALYDRIVAEFLETKGICFLEKKKSGMSTQWNTMQMFKENKVKKHLIGSMHRKQTMHFIIFSTIRDNKHTKLYMHIHTFYSKSTVEQL